MTQTEYKRRRRALARAMGADAIMVLPAAHELLRNPSNYHPFRQDSDFHYVTGFPEPDAFAVFAPGRKEGEFILFCHPHDAEHEQWMGARIGEDGAIADFGADQAFSLAELDTTMPGLIAGRSRVFFPIGQDATLDARVQQWIGELRSRVRSGINPPDTFVDSGPLLHEQRLRKSRAEIAVMRKAGKISGNAFRKLMQHCTPDMPELELDAMFQYQCASAGARFQAYPPIVASGANACTLHYTSNDARMRDGDLVLIDAGCELDNYASDITRTFPVNGRFSPAQRQLYDLVLASQLAGIAAAQPGKDFNAPHEAVLRVLTQGLVDLGILEGESKTLLEEEAYRPYYMHRTSHWLGMDVHDVGLYKLDGKWRLLEPGMILTMEPGLYIPDRENVPAAYRGIGIRIEDDVLITDKGNEILTSSAPKDPDEIERLMAG